MSVDKPELIELLEPVIAALGFEVVDLDCRFGHNGLLRVYIERIDGERGHIALADCELVSGQLSAFLDVEDPLPGRYVLEVSSPGTDRRLRTARHFEEFAGSEVRIELARAAEGQRRFRGRLDGIDGDEIVLAAEGRDWRFRLEDIAEARLIGA